METLSTDDESAEMDRVRARLRQEPPRNLWDESNLSSSDTSDSSVGSQTRPSTNTLKAPPNSCFTKRANQSSKDKKNSPNTNGTKNERERSAITLAETHDDSSSLSCDRFLAANYPKLYCSSFAPSDPVQREETHFDESFSFLDDCEALNELDRQIDASIQAKAETSPIPGFIAAAAAERSKELPSRMDSEHTRLLQLNYDDSLLLDDKALDELDRKVEATQKASLQSNDSIFAKSNNDRLQVAPSGAFPSVPCPSRIGNAVELEKNDSSLKINSDRVYTDIARHRHDSSDNSDSEIGVKRNPRVSSKRKRMDQYKVHEASTKKKRKQTPVKGSNGPKYQRRLEKREEELHSSSNHSSALRRSFRGDQTAQSATTTHLDTVDGTEMTDASSEDSFAFFNEDEINKIEQRARSEQRKRTSCESGDKSLLPLPPNASVDPVEVDSGIDENACPRLPSQERNLGLAVESPPQNDGSNGHTDRDESYFDQAFGFHDVAQIQENSNRDACNDIEFYCDKNAVGSLEKQHENDRYDFHSIEIDERMSEIDSKLYEPTPPENKQPPIVNRFSLANRPLNARRRVPVEQVFPRPLGSLWRTKFSAFNQMQSELANVLAYSDDNIVVSAPTGAGKTALFEMAVARFFSLNLQRQTRTLNEHQQVDKSQKIVYVSPSKALCDERYEDWSTRLGSMNLGIQVALVTGDGDPSASYKDLAQANVILTTPEKWDSLTRRWTENFFLFASVKLFLVDEVHLVADDSRGWCLESIVCRMKTIQKAAQRIRVTQKELQHSSYNNTTPEAVNTFMRTVAVSATLPNLEDIATFVEANEAHSFDESYRPVPLTVHVIGQGYVGDSSANQFRFWSGLDRNIPELIHRFSKKKPSLVFCHSKADTEKLTELLATERGIGFRSKTSSSMAGQSKNTRLQKALFYGLAYHHAGLEAEDRRLVEKCFSEGNIRVLCATSTLAMGVNLPAHLVIIKGTKAWRGGGRGYSDLDQATLLQMIGRAGRPGFDTTGTAIIMTDNRSKATFEKLANAGLDPAVSKLCNKLDEIINAEVSQNVITSTETAFNWINTSLYCAQLLRQPTLFQQGDKSEQKEEHLWRICRESLHRLEGIGALTTAGGKHVFALPASHVMSHNLVDYRAMEQFVDIPLDATQRGILLSLAQIEGMHRPVRRSEKRTLKLMHGQLKYKLEGPLSKVKIQQPFEKVFVLLQASMMRIPIEDHTLRQEMNMIAEFASRMLSALEEFSIRSTRNGIVVFQSIRLRRALSTNCWAANEGLLHRLAGVDPATAMNLKMAGICSFDDVMKRSSEDIENAANRPVHFGNRLKNTVEEVLKGMLTMKVDFEDHSPGATRQTVVCVIDRRCKMPTNCSEGRTSSKELSYTLVAYCDRSGGCILYRRNVSSPATYRALTSGDFQKVTFHLIASVAGLDETKELHCHNRTSADQYCDESVVLSNSNQSKPMISNPDRDSSRLQEVQLARNEKRALRHHNLVFVTPSPKVPSDTIGRKMTSKNEDLQEMRPSHSNVVGTQETNSILASTPLEGTSNVRRQSVRDDFSKRRDDFGSSFEGAWDHAAFSDVALVGNVASSESVFSPRNENTTHRSRSHTAWKREKLQQHRTQQRAFVRKKDNPFSDFKCDPNDAENALDNLSSLTTPSNNQVIPAEGLKALDSAYLERNSPYGKSHLTARYSRLDFTRPERARRDGALRNLPTNGFQTSWSTQSGRDSGDFACYSSVNTVSDQMAVNYGPYQLQQQQSRLDDSWYGQPSGNYSHMRSYPSTRYPTPASGHQHPDPFYDGYHSRGGHREQNLTSPTIQNQFALNRDTEFHDFH